MLVLRSFAFSVALIVLASVQAAAASHSGAKPSIHAAQPAASPALNISVSVSAPVPQTEGKGLNLTDWLLVLFNALLAVFTFMLWRATQGLWSATRGMLGVAEKQGADFRDSIAVTEIAAKAAERSAEIAERTLLLTQRPIMSLRQLRSAPASSAMPVQSFQIWGEWENRGSAFARNVALLIKLDVPADDAAPAIERPTRAGGGMMLAPHGQLETKRMTLSMAELADVYLNQSRLLVVTACFYGGLSGAGVQDYENVGCFEIVVPDDPSDWQPGDPSPLHFRIFETGNSAT